MLSHSSTTPITAISDGRGHLFGSGTNAPISRASFFPDKPLKAINEQFESRLASALRIDQTRRVLHIATPDIHRLTTKASLQDLSTKGRRKTSIWPLETGNRLLDAQGLRNDFYCSILAFSVHAQTLAVGLGNRVYLWSEADSVTYPGHPEDTRRNCFVSSLSFSSGFDGNDILAIGRSNGTLSLWALDETDDKFTCGHPAPISCVSFRPLARTRSSESGVIVSTEELLVGDELGVVYYYSVDWGSELSNQGSMCSMTLLARIAIHAQQVCGMAWSPDGAWFATGGNDNICLLFATRDIVGVPESRSRARSSTVELGFSEYVPVSTTSPRPLLRRSCSSLTEVPVPTFASSQQQSGLNGTRTHRSPGPPQSPKTVKSGGPRYMKPGDQRQAWIHAAAIKAIAFCPWQRSLLAVGGGSNDRAIHFYHTRSGACLGTIDVHAQVTSLIWSKTRREIAATFGYPQPEHSYRIAVFSWPECQQIIAIPWLSDCRALYAIPYPGGPNDPKSRRSGEGKRWWKRTDKEGSIVIACSDNSVKFHEVWCDKTREVQHGPGVLGWSDILEGLEGVYKSEDNTIR